MGMGFAPTWLRQVSPPPLLHKTSLTTEYIPPLCSKYVIHPTTQERMEHDIWRTFTDISFILCFELCIGPMSCAA